MIMMVCSGVELEDSDASGAAACNGLRGRLRLGACFKFPSPILMSIQYVLGTY
jgi:hypothetical protein